MKAKQVVAPILSAMPSARFCFGRVEGLAIGSDPIGQGADGGQASL
jgi:hypothetical protein